MRTFVANEDQIERKWYVVDAKGHRLGRLATRVADTLRGKKKAIFTPHVDCGDFVIVINAQDVILTGNKEEQKTYKRFSGYPGGLKVTTVDQLRKRHPDRLVQFAVKGMIPKGSLGRKVLRKLKIYGGANHPHNSQKPIKLELK